jgi:hypothetical protein
MQHLFSAQHKTLMLLQVSQQYSDNHKYYDKYTTDGSNGTPSTTVVFEQNLKLHSQSNI